MTMARSGKGAVALERELAKIACMSAAELKALWLQRRGTPAPPTLGSRLLRLALAYDVQSAGLGPEPVAIKRSWEKIGQQRQRGANADEALRRAPHVPDKVPAGTRLVKSWHGRTHEVEVREDGVYWNGQRYRSLSAVARIITGTNRNGPSFFGLRDPGQGA